MEGRLDAVGDGAEGGAETFAEEGTKTADGFVLTAKAGARVVVSVSEGTNEFPEPAS